MSGLGSTRYVRFDPRLWKGSLDASDPGVSERAFRRWRDRFEAQRAEGLYDRRLGKVSARRAAASIDAPD